MTQSLEEVYRALREQMIGSAAGMHAADEGDNNLVLRAAWPDPKNKQPAWFGAVQLKKNYVSYHLMPLYALPELKGGVSPELAKRMQGKSCFNCKKVEPELFEELGRVTATCAAAYAEPVQSNPHG